MKQAQKAKRAAAIFAIWQHRCAYCGGRATTLDHVIPLCAGGGSGWDNLVPACFGCNQAKDGKPIDEFVSDEARMESILKMLETHVAMKLRDYNPPRHTQQECQA